MTQKAVKVKREKTMFHTFQEIKKELAARKNAIRRDGEGRAVVAINVRDDGEFLSPYSMGEYNVINGEVAEFIEHSLDPIPVRERIHFEIRSDVITEDEQREYTAALHHYYADRYESAQTEKRRLHRISLLMALVAVVALAAMITLTAAGQNEIFIEVVDIFAWVFMWEAVDIFFLQCSLLRLKQKRYLALADSLIEYIPSGKTEESADEAEERDER